MNTLAYALKRIAPFFAFFLIIEFLVRISIIAYSWGDMASNVQNLPAAFLTGIMFDTVTFLYFAALYTFYLMALPQRKHGTKIDVIISSILVFIFGFTMLFSGTGEWFFWDEFQTRYNFIAVDYLVYTTEVIGNIRESYPVGTLVSIMALLCAGLSFAYNRKKLYLAHAAAPALKKRFLTFVGALALCVLGFFAISTNNAEISQNRYVSEVARNGIFELFSAFRNNKLDYSQFYITHPLPEVASYIREEMELKGNTTTNSPLDHAVTSPHQGKKYNLILVTVESLSADFLKRFGNTDNITPHLDTLINQSLFFDNMYATGTRTVYGLSAITLSMPPIPGNSIVRRSGNDKLFSLGAVLNEHGYDTKFIYGGFGYFDNMNAFFTANGYKIVDRSDFKKDEIHFANIWGVADDDLFNRVIKESDKSFAEGKPFFNMIMTTSNHRPYTYPEGKIDLPLGSGRRGGVKYTDYAINDFLENAAKKPWFKDTIFVIVADHTAGSSGKEELNAKKYHIPMWVYAPAIIKPRIEPKMASQIDIAPTVLALMHLSYESRFYGKNLLKETPDRAFISNYQKLGFLTPEGLTILKPMKEVSYYTNENGLYVLQNNVPEHPLRDAVTYFEAAAQWQNWSKDTDMSEK